MTKDGLSWVSIIRLGLVQMALGSIVVLTTSTLNRLMVVEAALPAIVPGLLVGLHYGVQITRPAWGFFSDKGPTLRYLVVSFSFFPPPAFEVRLAHANLVFCIRTE